MEASFKVRSMNVFNCKHFFILKLIKSDTKDIYKVMKDFNFK